MSHTWGRRRGAAVLALLLPSVLAAAGPTPVPGGEGPVLFVEARSGGRDEYPGLSRFVPAYFESMAGWLAAQER